MTMEHFQLFHLEQKDIEENVFRVLTCKKKHIYLKYLITEEKKEELNYQGWSCCSQATKHKSHAKHIVRSSP